MEVWFFSLVLVFGLSFASSAEDGCSRSAISLSNNESIEVEVGDCVTFQCTPNENDLVHWELNGTKIINDTHYNINTTSGTLTIQEVRSNDTGNYTCDLESTFLNVKIPNITITGQYTNLTVGSSVNVSCTTMPPIPNSVIRWHSSSFNTTNNKLIIDPVVLSNNNDTFTCTVSSSLLAKNLTESITISVIDTLTVHLLPSYVIGDKVSIVCTVRLISADVSSLVVNWFKDSTMRITDSITDSGLPPTHNSILTLTVGSPTDAGVYTCNASINAGSNIELTDSKPLCLRDLVPFNQGNDNFTNLSLGYNAIVQCVDLPSLNGITIKSIKWTNSNGDLISNNNTLILPNVVPSLNNTEYTCTAEVDTNPMTCSPDKRTITIDTKRTYVSSIIMSSQSSFLINSPFKIECIITLNTLIGPGIQPNVTWYHDETDITHYSSLMRNNDTAHVFTSLLTIDSIQEFDARVYNCNAGIDSNVTTNNIKVPDIIVTGRYTDLTVGSRVSINCTTMPSIPNSNIEWHSSSFNIDSNELIIDSVMLSHNNKMFTCTVSSSLLAMNLTKSITISVLDTSVSYVTVQSLSSYVIGDDVSIVCTISLTNAIGPDVSSLVVNWFKDDDMITTDDIIINGSLSTFNSTLTLTQVSSANAGVYTCDASINGSNIVMSDSKPLCLKDLVPFNQNTDSYTNLSLGYNATIECVNLSSLNGITIRSIKWTDSNGAIIGNNSSGGDPISDNNTLILPNVVPSLNNTVYTCTAEVDTNPMTCSPDNKTITIYTQKTYVSSIIMSSQLSSLINSTIKVDCIINLNTPVGPGIQPNVTWYHNMTNVTHYSSLVRDFEFDFWFTSILTINSIQVSNAGVYQCSAGIDSNVTTNSISICVTVNETLSSVTEELSLGQYYSIDCITGPVPTGVSVSWHTNGSIYSNNNTLMIPSILPSHDNKQYTCTIMIETNPSDCSTQSQTILFRVKATYINSVTVLPTSAVGYFINSTVVLTCTISLNTGIGPDTSFISHYWYRRSTDISDRSTPPMINGDSKSLVTTLTITNVQPSDAGKYHCRASIDDNDTVINNTVHFCVQVPVMNDTFDTDLRLGDTKEYDCTLGYNYDKSEVVVLWKEYSSNKAFKNPLILTVTQSINNTFYKCMVTITNNNSPSCPVQQVNVSVRVKDTFITGVMTSIVPLILSNTFHQLDCQITTNTDINTANTNTINSIVNVSWYKDNGNHGKTLVSDNEGVSILSVIFDTTTTSFISTLRFSPITSSTPVSTLGNYTCVAWIGEQSGRSKTSNNVQVMIKINNTKDVVNMSQLNTYYTAGDSFNVTCMITAHQLSPPIDTNGTVNIIHNESIVRSSVFDIGATGSYKPSLNIPFTNLKLSQSGEYTCSYIRSNNSFVQSSDIKKSDTTELNIKIPINSTSLKLKPTEPYYEAGDKVILSCKVTEPNSPLVNVDTTVNIKWSPNKNISQQYSTHSYNKYFNHTLTNIKLSDAGEYNCTYYINSSNPYIIPSDVRTEVTNVTIKIPKGTSPSITHANLNYTVGDSISLICSVTYPKSPLIDIATNVSMQWLNSSNHTLHSYTGINNYSEHAVSHTINNVSLSDAGEYTCQYSISSTNNSFVLPSDNMRNSTDVFIQIPNDKTPVINLIPHRSVYIAGSDITLSCSVTYPYSSYIDIPTSLTLQWFSSSNDTLNSSTIIDDYNEHTLTYTINNASLSDAGQYTCSFFINSSIPHIVTSNTTSNFTTINIKIPNVLTPHILVHPSKSYYNVNDNITLFCIINYPTDPLIDVNTTVNIQWLNYSLGSYTKLNDHTNAAEHTFNYTVNNLNLTDAGQYTCSFFFDVTENNDIIKHSDMTSEFINIKIILPRGTISSITISQDDPLFGVGSNAILSCSVYYANSSFIDVDTTVHIEWKHNGVLLDSHSTGNTFSNVSFEYHLSDVNNEEYTCESYLSATDANPFIKNSNITSNTTIVTEALAVPVVVGFIFFGIILIVIIGVVALIICWLKIRGLKPSGVKVKSKELYTFSRELTKEDTDISETYRLTLNEESLYQNVKATASTHKRPVNSFPSFVKTSKKEIEDEYEDIETLAPSKSDSIAKSHALKNRFQNISPFDDNIVPLVEIKGQEGSNYINASYVSGYCRHRAYIATQGPIPSTVVDFWRMVWEYKLPTIVMLTQLVEKGINKCACYWPEDLNSEQDIGEGMKLTLKSEEVNHGYSKRKLCIKIESDDGEESSLNVTQYHFTEWPDHGVPVDKIVMISFIDNIRSSHPPKGPPLVVHCSAGVGRTGTFIVMDTMLQKMKEEDTLNIYEFVLQIRHQRMKLVQTQAQYMYIHESLAEYIQCGDTSFLVTDAYHKIKDLNKSTDDGKTGFQKEFELLKELTDYSGTLSCSDAEENQDKNRFTYNLPYNNTRVCLVTTDEEDENNYINASRITGYKRNSLFIATQLPMKNTVNDFWKMVWQERCGTIVLLCPFPQTTEVFSFWPAQVKTCCEYDSAVVTLKSMIEDIGFNAYSLEIKTGDEAGSSRQSCLFHYQEWPADASRPKPGSSLVNLFESVVKNQSKTGNKPIVVICNDGVGCSGTFLTAYSQIERAKTEGVSDVFQFIRKARSQRPGLVDCLDQYIYCHEIISDFAEDMSQYDNFKRYI